MLEALRPDKILLIGKVPNELQNDEKILNIPSFMEQRRLKWAEEEAVLKHNQK